MKKREILLIILLFLSLNLMSNNTLNSDSIESKIQKISEYSIDELKFLLLNGSETDKIVSNYLLGKYFFSKKDYALSFQHFLTPIKSFGNKIPREFLYRLQVNCGLALFKDKNYLLAKEYFFQARKYIENKKDTSEMAMLYFDIGNNYFEYAKYDSAIIYYNQAVEFFQYLGNERKLAEVYLMQGNLAHIYKLSDLAIMYFQKAQSIFAKNNLSHDIVNALINLGVEYLQIAQLSRAAAVSDSAFNLSKSVKYTVGEFKSINQIAQLFARNGDYNNSLEFMKMADSISKQSTEIELKLTNFFNQATIYKLMKKYDLALFNYQKANQLQNKNELYIVSVETEIAEVYRLKRDFSKAIEWLELALTNAGKRNDLHAMGYIYFQFAELYYYFGKTERAQQIYLSLIDSVQSGKYVLNFELETGVYLRLSEIFEKIQNFEMAFYYYKNYERSRLLLYDRNFAFQLASIQNESNMAKLSSSINLLNERNIQKNMELLFQRKLSLLLTFFVIVFFALSGGLAYLFFRKNSLYQALLKTNVELSKQVPLFEEKSKLISIQGAENEKSKEIVNDLISLFEKEKIYAQKDLTLQKTADMLKTNRTYLSKAIHEILNTTFNSLINKYRIESARKMLADENQKLSIEGIAFSVGFSSKSTFNSAFKQFTGLTPSELRAKMLDSQ